MRDTDRAVIRITGSAKQSRNKIRITGPAKRFLYGEKGEETIS
jgi:hypothetical protein